MIRRIIHWLRKPKMLSVGAQAPDFSVTDHHGNAVSLADVTSRPTLLWWYPKADTPGCTIEGCAFRDAIEQIEAVGNVYGVSFDTAEENAAFAEKFAFPFPLLCDTTKAMSIAYGAAKTADAPYPNRISYIVGTDGRIAWAEPAGDIEAHVAAAVQAMKDL